MHSRRVGFLNVVRSALAYFGLTNSGIEPPVLSSAAPYASSSKINVLTLPGYGEYPLSSAVSPPPPFSLSNASSWLYSTLITFIA